MHRFVISALLLLLTACGKEHDNEIAGTVTDQEGCYPDYRLVMVEPQGGHTKNFLCDPSVPTYTDHNCKNAVFIKVPPHLDVPGKKIRFVFNSIETSCFSSMGTANHITVKKIAAD